MVSNLIGRTLGQYQLLEVLGQGGMSTVYRARQPSMNRDVAVKVLAAPDNEKAEEFMRRFDREALTVAGLSHAHILKVFDYGKEEDLAYLAMELLTGGTLADKIDQGPIPIREITKMLSQVAPALDFAHQKGVIHRDLKPGNIMFDEAGNAFLTDFGIIKLLNNEEALTRPDAVVGTPAYIAPEQWQGIEIDRRADVYALGVTLYQMLTGKQPFEHETLYGMMKLHLERYPTPVNTFRSGLPRSVQDCLDRALAKDRTERFATAGELATAFTRAAAAVTTGTADQLSETEKMRPATPHSEDPTKHLGRTPQVPPPPVVPYTSDNPGDTVPMPIYNPNVHGAGNQAARRPEPPRGAPLAASEPPTAPKTAKLPTGVIVAGGAVIFLVIMVILAATGGGALNPADQTETVVAELALSATATLTLTPSITPTETPVPPTVALQVISPTAAPTTAVPIATGFATVATATPTLTLTPTLTPSLTPSHTLTPSRTPTLTPTDAPSATPTFTPTATFTPTVTETPDPALTATALYTATQRAFEIESGEAALGAERIFGPQSGELAHGAGSDLATLTISESGVRLQDFVVDVRFQNPYSASEARWDCGFIFRRDSTAQYRLLVRSDMRWFLVLRTDQTQVVQDGNFDALNFNAGELNRLRLVVKAGEGWFFVNDKFVSKLDVSQHQVTGDVLLGTGISAESKKESAVTRFEEWTISEIASQ